MHTTTEDVIRAALATKQINAHGGSALIHEFPKEIPELSGHLIRRMPWHFSLRKLHHTSSMQPVKQFVTCMHVAQPLTRIGDKLGFDIMLRQPGIPLADWDNQLRKRIELAHPSTSLEDYARNAAREIIAFTDLVETFEHQRCNPFHRPLDETYQLGLLGLDDDSNTGNIMVDELGHQFGLVDQFNAPILPRTQAIQAEHNLTSFNASFKTAITPHRTPLVNAALEKELTERRVYATARLDEARAAVQRHHFGPHAKPVMFGNVESVKAVKLSEPPDALIEQLRQLETLADIPQR